MLRRFMVPMRSRIGFRPAEELYDLTTDADCVQNLAAEFAQAERMAALRGRMEAELRAQNDPRLSGKGRIFDEYKPTSGGGFYEQFMRGEKPRARRDARLDLLKQSLWDSGTT